MTDKLDAAKLTDRVAALVEAARRAGADAADAVAVRGRSAGVTVRLGKVEGTESSESEDVSLRVFIGQRVASVSATAASDPKALAERAVAMAKVSPEDPFQGLADPALLVRNLVDLDLFDPTEVSADQLKEAALAAEAAALAVKGVTNSAGSSAGAGLGGLVLATSHGFVGQYVASRFSRSTSVIAGEGTAMERDYEFSSRQHFADLDAPQDIGRKAGERAVRRLGARKAATGPVDVVFDPRVARGIAGHLAGAINGAAVARKTSFLRDMMGKQVASAAITVTDDPLRRRGQASRPFDGEGIVRSEEDEEGREGEGEEDQRIQHRADQRTEQRCAPPGQTAKAVEDRDIKQLPGEIGRTGGDRNARLCRIEGQRDADDEAGKDDLARGLGAELAVGQIGDEKGDRIGKGAPGEDIRKIDAGECRLQRILHEDIGGDDDQRHQQNVDKGIACRQHFFILGDATS